MNFFANKWVILISVLVLFYLVWIFESKRNCETHENGVFVQVPFGFECIKNRKVTG